MILQSFYFSKIRQITSCHIEIIMNIALRFEEISESQQSRLEITGTTSIRPLLFSYVFID